MKITTGTMPFKGYKTWYRIVEGERTDKPPILLLHGGPGSTHNYMELLDVLADTGRAVISYDQLGCGESYVEGHPELWTMNTWLEELISLRQHLGLDCLHIMGQSFGGMLLLQYLCDHPKGISSAILSSTLPASWLWAKEQHRMIRYMSEEDQQAIAQAEATDDYTDPAYLAANDRYMELHCASTPTENSPECLRRPKRSGTESYRVGWGPNEYTPTGTLKDYDVIDQLPGIQTPCLIISGTDDLCTPLVAKTMLDALPHSQWELMEKCRHMCFADDNPKYVAIMRNWLEKHDQ